MVHSTWEELWDVRQVEQILAPVSVTLTSLSNMTLLIHETRVVWRSRKLIPPKLLVMALAATDLIATLFGFMPLWILFEVSGPSKRGSPTTYVPHCNRTDPWCLSGTTTWPDLPPCSNWTTDGVSLSLVSNTSPPTRPRPPPSSPFHPTLPLVHTAGYAMGMFLLTTFWTLAQCIVVVMGVERFLAMRAPFFYSARCSCTSFLVVLGILTLVSCCVGSFHVVVHLEEVQEKRIVFAGFMDSRFVAHNVFTLVQGLVWTVVLLLCNWAVLRELRRMKVTVSVLRGKDRGDYMTQMSMVHGAGREFARFMMAVNILFLLSSSPFLICVLLRLCDVEPTFRLYYMSWRMSHVAALLNPFLYGFLRKSLRNRFRRFLNQHIKCLRPARVGELEAPGRPVAYYHTNAISVNSNLDNHNSNLTDLRDPEASTVHLSN